MPPVGYPYPGYPPQSAQPRTTGGTALKYGLIFGAILVVANLIDTGVSRVLVQVLIGAEFSASVVSVLSFIPTIIFTLVYWVIYFLAGLFAARQARNVTAATLAGLLASLCFFVVYFVVVLINVASVLGTITRYGGVGGYLSSLGVDIAITLIVQIGLGIGLAALGGLLGKGKSA